MPHTNAHYDRIIIGSGVAGLTAALAALPDQATPAATPPGRTLLLTKAALEDGATRYAQGGIAAALGADDSAAAHLQDTVAAGAGLVDEQAAAILTGDAAARIEEMAGIGVPFDRVAADGGDAGRIALGREAAHSAFRIVHAGGDATGYHLEQTLADRVRAAAAADKHLDLRERVLVTRILVEGGRAAGVEALDCATGRTERIDAPTVILATGGAGKLYRFTTNPEPATGDGIALAYEAGAEIMDMEFIQFHPTALRLPGAPTFLISEAVRGEGAILRDESGHPFMAEYDLRAELAPRDVVARAIHTQIERTGADHVYLDLSHLPAAHVRERFPQIDAFCLGYGIDITRDLVPVAPAAHYTMGGVRTSNWGETNVPGLFAAGEVACTGVHGANRLASNSLLEGLVFGRRVIERSRSATTPPAADPAAVSLEMATAGETPPPSREQLQRLMWDDGGIVRNAEGLDQARIVLSAWAANLLPAHDQAGHELANLLLAGRLVAEAAWLRRESRGAHYREDFPYTDAAAACHRVFRKDARATSPRPSPSAAADGEGDPLGALHESPSRLLSPLPNLGDQCPYPYA